MQHRPISRPKKGLLRNGRSHSPSSDMSSSIRYGVDDESHSGNSGSSGSGTIPSKANSSTLNIPIHHIEDLKLVEELKVVRHLTRSANNETSSRKSSRSKRSKSKKKRGNSLERDISRTILQTASAGAHNAHFLVEGRPIDDANNKKSAQFILSDLVDNATDSTKDQGTANTLRNDDSHPPKSLLDWPVPNDKDFEEPFDCVEGHEQVNVGTFDDFFNFIASNVDDVADKGNATTSDEDRQSDIDLGFFPQSSYLSGHSTPQTSNTSKDENILGAKFECDGDETDEIFNGLESFDSNPWNGLSITKSSEGTAIMESIPEGIEPTPASRPKVIRESTKKEARKVNKSHSPSNPSQMLDAFDDDEWTTFDTSPFSTSVEDRNPSDDDFFGPAAARFPVSSNNSQQRHNIFDPLHGDSDAYSPFRGDDRMNPFRQAKSAPSSPSSVADFEGKESKHAEESRYETSSTGCSRKWQPEVSVQH